MAGTGEKGFRKLFIWQRARQLVVLIYSLSGPFPEAELFGLTSQMRRGCGLVPANIAEGYAAGGKGQFGWFLKIAQGLLAEVGYYLCRDLIMSLSHNARKPKPCAGDPGSFFAGSSNLWKNNLGTSGVFGAFHYAN